MAATDRDRFNRNPDHARIAGNFPRRDRSPTCQILALPATIKADENLIPLAKFREKTRTMAKALLAPQRPSIEVLRRPRACLVR